MNETPSIKFPDTINKILGYKTLSTVVKHSRVARLEDWAQRYYRHAPLNAAFHLKPTGYLKSPMYEQVWESVDMEMECRCRIRHIHYNIMNNEVFNNIGHIKPSPESQCGIYSYHNYQSALELSSFMSEPIVSLSNYGTMQVHYDGMRSEKANITGILLNATLHKDFPRVYDVPYFYHTPQGIEDFIANAEKHAQKCPEKFKPEKPLRSQIGAVYGLNYRAFQKNYRAFQKMAAKNVEDAIEAANRAVSEKNTENDE